MRKKNKAKKNNKTDTIMKRDVVYTGEQNFINDLSLRKVIVDENVTVIFNDAFSRCKNLEEVEIPDSVTEIGDNAFYYCKKLKKVEIPDSVTKIGDNSFHNCKSLKEVTISNSVTKIGNVFFKGCASLEEVEIPNSITEIGDSAFEKCIKLKEITIPDSVTEIGDSAFKWCTNLERIVIPKSVTKIGESVFYSCRNLKEVEISDSVTKIGQWAFYSCVNLKEVEIPDSVTRISSYAFYCCIKLKKVKIPNSVTKISSYAFYCCQNLCIHCNKGSYAEKYAILNNIQCEYIDIEQNDYDFINEIKLKNKQKNEEVIYDGKASFENNNEIKKAIVKSCIYENAFKNCVNLKEVEILDSVTEISEGAFCNFMSIKRFAFQNCNSLMKVEIPNSVIFIDKLSFDNCPNLCIYCNKGSYAEKYAMLNNIKYKYINSKSKQKNEEVFYYGKVSFENNNDIKKVIVKSCIIYENAFKNCVNLKEVEILDSVTEISEGAFCNCKSLKEIVIPNSVKFISKSVFENCGELSIYCNRGSYAENYAVENNIRYKYIDGLDEIETVEMIEGQVILDVEKNNTDNEIILDIQENNDIEVEQIEEEIENNIDKKIILNFDDEIIEDDEDKIDFSSFENRRHVYLEYRIVKQIKDRKLERDLEKLIVKINKDLSLNSLGFKKYEGINENIYGIDFSNSQNTGDRIIVCFLNDYIDKAEFSFERYNDIKNENDPLLLFCISEHDRQNDTAKKIANRISNNFYNEDDFDDYESDNKNKSNNMTFNFVDFANGRFIYEEVLTMEQSNNLDIFIKKPNPFILQGIAGSGKTLSTLNLLPDIKKKLEETGEDTGKVLYVTFSNSLKKYVQDIIEQRYSNYNSFLEIKTFDELCIDIYYKYISKEIDRNSIITQNLAENGFDKFLNCFLEETRDKYIKDFLNNSNKELIYSEIFGILKGSMYVNWDRDDSDIINKEYYFNNEKVIDDYKAFHGKDREYIYLITEKYNQWLKDNQKYDINDLAFCLFDIIKEKSIAYEYVIVDEVQDFTEVQIYMLFLLAKEYSLNITSKTKRIFLAGDPNQVINPTFFKIGRLKALFYLNEYNCNNKILHENFRNSHKIMDINNIVNEIINDKLPARKLEEQQKEILKNNKSGVVELVKFSENNLKIILDGIKNSPKIAIIVSDENKKSEINNKYKCDNVFTVTEIKGREFDNIIVYNVLSDNINIYEEVYKKDKISEGHYSYYFNRFYVSITRANYNLVLIEEKESKLLQEIKDKLGDKLDYIDNLTTFEELGLGEINGNSLDLLNLGIEFIYDENFKQAKLYLSRSMEKESKDYLKACDLILNLENPDDSQKGYIFLNLKKYKLAQDYFNKAHNYKLASILYLHRNDLTNKNELFIDYVKNKSLDLNDLCKEYLSTSRKLMEFLKEEESVYDELSIDILKRVSKSGSLKATKKLSEIYLDKEDIELYLSYQMKLVGSEYGKDYEDEIKRMLKDGYLEEDSSYQTQLGLELYLGRFIERDLKKALEVLKIADEKGSVLAGNYLSLIQYNK